MTPVALEVAVQDEIEARLEEADALRMKQVERARRSEYATLGPIDLRMARQARCGGTKHDPPSGQRATGCSPPI